MIAFTYTIQETKTGDVAIEFALAEKPERTGNPLGKRPWTRFGGID